MGYNQIGSQNEKLFSQAQNKVSQEVWQANIYGEAHPRARLIEVTVGSNLSCIKPHLFCSDVVKGAK